MLNDDDECEFSAVIVSVPVSFLLALLLGICMFHCYTLGFIVLEDMVCGEFVPGCGSPETLGKASTRQAKPPLKH